MCGKKRFNLLYTDPGLYVTNRPTAAGNPILFPFPNRIRDGRFLWDGMEYQLPCNEAAEGNAIHGLVFNRSWRLVDQEANDDGAWVTGEFQSSRDAPATTALWPADYLVRITYRLTPRGLRIETLVANPDQKPLPYGLGLHPYFRLPLSGDIAPVECRLQVPADSFWDLEKHLPTGARRQVAGTNDLRSPQSCARLTLDDVFTNLNGPQNAQGLRLCARLQQPSAKGELQVWASPAFRELLVYTPSHRQAICLEPYTCVTDAVHLQARGIDAGWQVLAPGEQRSAEVMLELVAAS